MATAVPVVAKISDSVIALSHPLLINFIPLNLISSNNKNSGHRFCYTKYGGRSRKLNWEKKVKSQRFGFNFDREYENEEEFGFRNGDKKRDWWYDEAEDEFGFKGASIGIDWIFKLFRAFGWMVPAIGISMLLGTGPNTFVMALALPLAQSALSLVTDALMGRWSDNPRPKKRPFSRATSNVQTNKQKEQNRTKTNIEGKNYRSWTTSSEASARKGDKGKPNFGGWDELDKRAEPSKVPRMAQTEKASEPRQQRKINLSRRVRNREKSLLRRLLIAVFPFLGSWTKLL